MKRVEALIRPEQARAVLDALTDIGYGNVTVTEVRSHGDELGSRRQWRGMAYIVDVLPKSKVEVLVQDPMLQRVVSVIQEHASTGGCGDGTITVVAIEDVIDVHSGSHGMVRAGV